MTRYPAADSAGTWGAHDSPDSGQPWMSTTGRPGPPVSSTCTLTFFSRPEWAVTSVTKFPLQNVRLKAGPGGSRMQQDLGPAVLALVETLVTLGRLVQGQLLRDDHARLQLAPVDQVAQAAVVLLDVGLPGAHGLALEEERAEVEGELALLGQLVGGRRVLGHEHPDHADPAGGPHRLDQAVDGQARALLAVVVVSLVADGLHALVGAFAPGGVQHLLHGVTSRVVDRGRAQLLGQPQPARLPVDHQNLVGPAQLG